MFFTLLAVAVAIAVIGDAYDISLTEKGLAKGLAYEGNTWLVGAKPTAKALILRDGLVLALCLAAPLIAFAVCELPVAIGSLAAPVVFGIKHYLGGRAWKKLGA